MSRRQFVETPVREDGQPVPRYRLVCGSCGCGETLGRQNFGPSIAHEQVPKKFGAKGWGVGQRQDGSDDRCPSCVNREQEARRNRTPFPPRRTNAGKRGDVESLLGTDLSAREISRRVGVSPQTVCNIKLRVVEKEECVSVPQPSPIIAAVPQTKFSAAGAEKPREMTRDERRLIWAKLEDVYIDERAGYSAGWTDARVSEDLGIPRAWVSTIRDENFGPGISEDVEKTLAEARAVTAEAAEFRKAMDALTARGAEILKRADAVERTARRIETAVR